MQRFSAQPTNYRSDSVCKVYRKYALLFSLPLIPNVGRGDVAGRLLTSLEDGAHEFRSLAYSEIHRGPWDQVWIEWRDLYTIASIRMLGDPALREQDALRTIDMALLFGACLFRDELKSSAGAPAMRFDALKIAGTLISLSSHFSRVVVPGVQTAVVRKHEDAAYTSCDSRSNPKSCTPGVPMRPVSVSARLRTRHLRIVCVLPPVLIVPRSTAVVQSSSREAWLGGPVSTSGRFPI